jgi:protease I
MKSGTKVGVFLFNGFQEMEFWYPVLRLREEGAEVAVIGAGGVAGPESPGISQLGYPVVPNLPLSQAKAADFAALIVPGGNVDALKKDAALGAFLKEAASNGAVLAAATAAAALLPASSLGKGKSLVAQTTDDVPQWTRSLIKELS